MSFACAAVRAVRACLLWGGAERAASTSFRKSAARSLADDAVSGHSRRNVMTLRGGEVFEYGDRPPTHAAHGIRHTCFAIGGVRSALDASFKTNCGAQLWGTVHQHLGEIKNSLCSVQAFSMATSHAEDSYLERMHAPLAEKIRCTARRTEHMTDGAFAFQDSSPPLGRNVFMMERCGRGVKDVVGDVRGVRWVAKSALLLSHTALPPGGTYLPRVPEVRE